MTGNEPVRAGRITAWIVVAVLTLLSLHLARPVHGGLWLQTFYDFLHVPVFGVVTFAVFAIVGEFFGSRPLHRIALSAAIVLVAGVFSELAQIPGPRDASLEDLASNWLGTASILLLAVALSYRGRISRNATLACVIAGTGLLLTASSQLLLVSAAYLERNSRIPVLVTFDSWFGGTFLRMQNARIESVELDDDRRAWAKVTLQQGSWPGLVFHDLWRDWSSYEALVLEFRAAGEPSIDINVRVHDLTHKRDEQQYSDRYNARFTLGRHRIVRIPIDEIERAPRTRDMDVTDIDGLVIFCSRADAGRGFLITDIRLE